MSEAALKAYKDALEDYHTDLLDVASLSAHLLDLCIDDRQLPDWRVSACHLMSRRLLELAETLPFPSMASPYVITPREEVNALTDQVAA